MQVPKNVIAEAFKIAGDRILRWPKKPLWFVINDSWHLRIHSDNRIGYVRAYRVNNIKPNPDDWDYTTILWYFKFLHVKE